jgi:hypothetical protein
MEPPFWWVDMNHNQLELMIYGENISQYKPSIHSVTIRITGVKRTENENYIFLNLDVSNAISGTFKIDFSKKGKKNNFSIDYELKERSENSKNR